MKSLYKIVSTINFDRQIIIDSLENDPDVFPKDGPETTIDVIRNAEQAKLITDTIGLNYENLREILVIKMPPQYSNTIHSDGDERFLGTLIPLTQCNDVYMQWWDPIETSMIKEMPDFPLFAKDVVYKMLRPEQAVIKDRIKVDQMLIADVNKYHNVKNEGTIEEWFLSIRFKLCKDYVQGISNIPETFERVENFLFNTA